MAVTAVTDSDFKDKIAGEGLKIIKYYADWCGSCRLIAPKFNKLSDTAPDVTFLEVNAEANPEARKVAGVSNLPFFAVFKNGELVEGDCTAKIESVTEMITRARN